MRQTVGGDAVVKVKISSIIKFIFVVLILIRYSFLKLLGNQLTIFSTAYDQYPMVMFYIFMVIFLFLFSRVYSVEAKYLWILSVLCLFATGVGIYSATSNNGLDFMGALSQGIEYIYVILAIPLCYLLNNELWDFRNLLKLLVVLGIVSYAIRWGISFYYDVSGTVAFPNIAQESASSEWIREGVLRVNPPFIGIIFAPIVYYLALTTSKKFHKWIYYLCIVMVIAYTIRIHQARSLMIYQLVAVVVLLIFQKVTDRKKLLRIGILFIGIVILVNTSWFSNLVDSFSKSNADYGGSTRARINAIAGFGVDFLKSPVFGFGFLESDAQRLTIGGHITDIGILHSIFMLGIPIVVVFLMIFIRGFYVYSKANKVGMCDEALLVLGMTVLVMMTGINIDLFVGIFSFAIPFYLAITEYVLHRSREYEIWES
jgi:hypothetical protein